MYIPVYVESVSNYFHNFRKIFCIEIEIEWSFKLRSIDKTIQSSLHHLPTLNVHPIAHYLAHKWVPGRGIGAEGDGRKREEIGGWDGMGVPRYAHHPSHHTSC